MYFFILLVQDSMKFRQKSARKSTNSSENLTHLATTFGKKIGKKLAKCLAIFKQKIELRELVDCNAS